MLAEGEISPGIRKGILVDSEGRIILGSGNNSISGSLPVESSGIKNTATVTRVAASASVVTLLAANTNRRRVIIYNDSTGVLLVKLGSAASATSFTHRLNAGDEYESPTDWVYTGIVTGIWDSATGAAQVTEI